MIQAGDKMRPDATETTPLLALPLDQTPRGRSGPKWWRSGLVEPVAVIYLISNGYMSALRTQFLYSRVADNLGKCNVKCFGVIKGGCQNSLVVVPITQQ